MLSNYGKIRLANFLTKYLTNEIEGTYEREVIDGIEFALFISSEGLEVHIDINGTKLMGADLLRRLYELNSVDVLVSDLVAQIDYRLQEYTLQKGA